jgi:hypothetical protein
MVWAGKRNLPAFHETRRPKGQIFLRLVTEYLEEKGKKILGLSSE